MSVITAADAMKPTTVDNITTEAASGNAARDSGSRGQAQNRAAVPMAARNGASRAANSFTPSRPMVAALPQNDSGGLPQNGTPWSNQGVTQLPVSSILRAISA